jgi:hypothetical protein
MTGTDSVSQEKSRAPSPFVEELADRQRDIAQRGAEPWNAPVEERRAARRRDMEIMRLASMEAALHLTEYIAGRLPGWKREALEGIKDPMAALANLNRALIQITLAEDRFDETGEERRARIAAEAEAKARAEREAEAQLAYTETQVRRAENRRQVHETVRAITLSSLRLPFSDREKLLAGLFRELEDEGAPGDAYDRDPAETAADLCLRLGIGPKGADPAHLLERRAGCHRSRPYRGLARSQRAGRRRRIPLPRHGRALRPGRPGPGAAELIAVALTSHQLNHPVMTNERISPIRADRRCCRMCGCETLSLVGGKLCQASRLSG